MYSRIKKCDGGERVGVLEANQTRILFGMKVNKPGNFHMRFV
jgi:hypothetical protein